MSANFYFSFIAMKREIYRCDFYMARIGIVLKIILTYITEVSNKTLIQFGRDVVADILLLFKL